ncbi:MAG: putative ABC transport system ATP-binding protein [Hyphomonadaceae bacterium]|nr:MAG: putative ABC transport system ATP-binding protein [Hyphomonadaceae bacterium]
MNYVDAVTPILDCTADQVAIRLRNITNKFGDFIIHKDLDLDVLRGETIGFVGGSGAGKSVLLRTIIGLNRPFAGKVDVLGIDVWGENEAEQEKLASKWGVMFQDGALFSSLTVLENVMVPLKEHTNLSPKLMGEIAALKVLMAGLPKEAGDKLPSELSGGMRKRAALARALALDPDILFLDEPTAGLDPITAGRFDDLINDLKQALGLTVFIITHDLDTLRDACDRVAALANQRVSAIGPLDYVREQATGWLEEYFSGPRGRAALG